MNFVDEVIEDIKAQQQQTLRAYCKTIKMPSRKTLLYSIFMRTLIESSKENNNHTRFINEKLIAGEIKYYNLGKTTYNEINEKAKEIWSETKIHHPMLVINTELVLEGLWREQEEEFEEFFKLKEKPFVKLFNYYAKRREFEHEQHSFNLISTILKLSEKV